MRRGIHTGALVRQGSTISERTQEFLRGAEIISCDVSNQEDTEAAFLSFQPTSTICCLASRSGVPKDAWAVDYTASLHTLKAFEKLRNDPSTGSFVLLSAYCCGKPVLQFQFAKLALEEAIRGSAVSHSIVRPTAFFKSVDGQIESARKGNPILLFGDGSCCANPICESDLSSFLVDCALAGPQLGMSNATRAIGGPDVPPLTKLQQADLIFSTLNIPLEKRKIVFIPLAVFGAILWLLSAASSASRALGMGLDTQEKFTDAIELAKIVRYYAEEPMVALGPGEVQGVIRLREHFEGIASRGGVLEEVDPMTTTTGVLNVFANDAYDR